jgi:hypothetical protein
MPIPVRPKTCEPPIVATVFLYTPPAVAASTTVDVNLAWNAATQSITVTGGGTVAAAPGYPIEAGIGRLRANYNVSLWTTNVGTMIGLSISNPCCVTSGQLNFRLSNSSTGAITPAQWTLMLVQQ